MSSFIVTQENVQLKFLSQKCAKDEKAQERDSERTSERINE